MQNHSLTMQLTSPISSENLMQSRLGELGLQSIRSIDVGDAGDCFFRSVSHQLYDRGVLPYMGYIGMCPPKGMVFRLFWS